MLKWPKMSRNVGRAQIAQKIADELGLRRSQTPYKLVMLLIQHLKDCIFNAGELSIHRFGVFYLLKRKSRIGRNPQTGEKIILPERIVIKFKASPLLKDFFTCENS